MAQKLHVRNSLIPGVSKAVAVDQVLSIDRMRILPTLVVLAPASVYE